MDKLHVIVKAIVKIGDEYLLVRRSEEDDIGPGMWEFPGGKVEHSEDPEDSLRREVLEETGLNVSIVRTLYTWSDTFHGDHYVGITYLCTSEGGNILLSNEHTDYALVPKGSFREYIDFDGIIRSLDKIGWCF